MKKFHFTLFLIIPCLYTNITFSSEKQCELTSYSFNHKDHKNFITNLLIAKKIVYKNGNNRSADEVKKIFNNLAIRTHNDPNPLIINNKTPNLRIEVEIASTEINKSSTETSSLPTEVKKPSTKTTSSPIEIKQPSIINTKLPRRIIEHTLQTESPIACIAYNKGNPYGLSSKNDDDDDQCLFAIDDHLCLFNIDK